MENRRSFIENFTYRWDEEEQRYVRAYRRDPDPSEIEGAPQHHHPERPHHHGALLSGAGQLADRTESEEVSTVFHKERNTC